MRLSDKSARAIKRGGLLRGRDSFTRATLHFGSSSVWYLFICIDRSRELNPRARRASESSLPLPLSGYDFRLNFIACDFRTDIKSLPEIVRNTWKYRRHGCSCDISLSRRICNIRRRTINWSLKLFRSVRRKHARKVHHYFTALMWHNIKNVHWEMSEK